MSPNTSSASLVAMLVSPWHHRRLLMQLTSREIHGRYKGSIGGIGWSLFNPLLMLTVYTTVFSGIFKSKWGITANETHQDFALMLFAGLIIHGVLADCLGRAPGLILGNTNLVKKVIFPLEVLPWVTVLTALFHGAISILVLILAHLLLNHSLPVTMIALPLIILPLALLSLGCTWLLSATGVYIRDLSQATGLLITLAIFLSPVFYPVSAVPAGMQTIVAMSPLTLLIESLRAIVIAGQWPEFGGLFIHTCFSLIFAWAGFWWFQKTRKGFADVM